MLNFNKFLKNHLFSLMNFYPPFIGAGVKIEKKTRSGDSLRVSMPLRIYNRNYVGTHFGGSLYSMCDPFLMLILMRKIGKNYIVWDKEASIKFIKPGRSKVWADFEITDEEVERIKNEAESGESVLPKYEVKIFSEDNELVAVVSKTLYVKKKS